MKVEALVVLTCDRESVYFLIAKKRLGSRQVFPTENNLYIVQYSPAYEKTTILHLPPYAPQFGLNIQIATGHIQGFFP